MEGRTCVSAWESFTKEKSVKDVPTVRFGEVDSSTVLLDDLRIIRVSVFYRGVRSRRPPRPELNDLRPCKSIGSLQGYCRDDRCLSLRYVHSPCLRALQFLPSLVGFEEYEVYFYDSGISISLNRFQCDSGFSAGCCRSSKDWGDRGFEGRCGTCAYCLNRYRYIKHSCY